MAKKEGRKRRIEGNDYSPIPSALYSNVASRTEFNLGQAFAFQGHALSGKRHAFPQAVLWRCKRSAPDRLIGVTCLGA